MLGQWAVLNWQCLSVGPACQEPSPWSACKLSKTMPLPCACLIVVSLSIVAEMISCNLDLVPKHLEASHLYAPQSFYTNCWHIGSCKNRKEMESLWWRPAEHLPCKLSLPLGIACYYILQDQVHARQWPEVLDLCHTCLHVTWVKKNTDILCFKSSLLTEIAIRGSLATSTVTA